MFDTGWGDALVRHEDGLLYLAFQLRNGGAGVAHLFADRSEPEPADRVIQDPRGRARHRRGDPARDRAAFAEQQRDLYIAAGELGHWQAALGDATTELYTATSEAITILGRMTFDLLYRDIEDGPPTITRFALLPSQQDKWRCDVTRHWRHVDGKSLPLPLTATQSPSGVGSDRPVHPSVVADDRICTAVSRERPGSRLITWAGVSWSPVPRLPRRSRRKPCRLG
jgi:hypothetical protein